MAINIKARQLQLLLNDFELMARTALTQLHISTKLLEDNSIASLYEEAEANEIIMDRLEVKVREEVVFAIFQFSPKAADLRKIIAYQDITNNLERVGDMLLNIIHYSKQTDINLAIFSQEKKMLQKMIGYVTEMLQKSLFSFSNEESNIAYQVIKEDDKVDDLFYKISLSLQEAFANKLLTEEDIRNIMNVNAISQNLERIGDNATNIAEAAIYLTEGKDVRHGNKN